MKKIMFSEVWKDVAGFEGLYEVSNYGKVRRYDTKRLKATPLNRFGYPQLNLYKNGKSYLRRVHRLVAVAFVDNPEPIRYDCINHKDENPCNNNANNLEWCDRKYNNNYGGHNARIAKSRSKPIIQYDLNGKVVREWESATSAARTLGCAQSGINWCCLRKPKHNTYIGFIWRLADDKDVQYKNGKAVVKYDSNENLIEEYINITTAAKKNKLCITSITNCVKGRTKTAGGFKWKYK